MLKSSPIVYMNMVVCVQERSTKKTFLCCRLVGYVYVVIELMPVCLLQMDYLLGDNPLKRSMMVGFGNNPPVRAHHRGASVPVMATNEEINCGMSFVYWYNTDKPNPNELTGAILGGPDKQDRFVDSRVNSSMTEPCTYVNSCAIGVLAKLAKK